VDDRSKDRHPTASGVQERSKSGPRDFAIEDMVNRRAARLMALADLVAGHASQAAVRGSASDRRSSHPHWERSPHRIPPPPSTRQRKAGRSGAAGSEKPRDSTARRQTEILLRMDENLRRLRQLAETHQQEPAVFANPEH